MGIDWYTTIFKIINFLILVFLLRYFLYGPVTRIMNEREQKILDRESEAEQQIAEAEKTKELYQDKTSELDSRKEEIMEQARVAASEEKSKLLKKAREEVDETKRRWKDSLAREKDNFLSEIRQKVGKQACSIASRVLKGLSDVELQSLVWKHFIGKIDKLDPEESDILKKAIAESSYRVLLVTAFEPLSAEINQLKERLNQLLPEKGEALDLSTKIDSSLICGLELEVESYQLAWNVNSYLSGVEEEIMKEFEDQNVFEPAEEEALND